MLTKVIDRMNGLESVEVYATCNLPLRLIGRLHFDWKVDVGDQACRQRLSFVRQRSSCRSRSAATRVRMFGCLAVKTQESYDFSSSTSTSRCEREEMAALSFVDRRENVRRPLEVAGKTHLRSRPVTRLPRWDQHPVHHRCRPDPEDRGRAASRVIEGLSRSDPLEPADRQRDRLSAALA
jgi:hypothetical protein